MPLLPAGFHIKHNSNSFIILSIKYYHHLNKFIIKTLLSFTSAILYKIMHIYRKAHLLQAQFLRLLTKEHLLLGRKTPYQNFQMVLDSNSHIDILSHLLNNNNQLHIYLHIYIIHQQCFLISDYFDQFLSYEIHFSITFVL